MKHAVPDYPDHPELGWHAEDIPYMSEHLISEIEARNYLQICKESYLERVKSANAMMVTLRGEISFWEGYIKENFPAPEKAEPCQSQEQSP